MVAYNKFEAFLENAFEKVHDLGADTLKIMLTNTAPVATNSVKADLTEITAGNGYTAGGVQVTISSSAQSSGTYRLIGADPVITASGGTIGPFRYAVLYNDTPTSPADPLIAWWDRGSSATLADGESFTLDLDATNGIFSAA